MLRELLMPSNDGVAGIAGDDAMPGTSALTSGRETIRHRKVGGAEMEHE